jgi:hypothetical protein
MTDKTVMKKNMTTNKEKLTKKEDKMRKTGERGKMMIMMVVTTTTKLRVLILPLTGASTTVSVSRHRTFSDTACHRKYTAEVCNCISFASMRLFTVRD